MASFSREKGQLYRIHWKFKVRAGPRAGETIEGSLQLGRCTRATAKAKLREIESWEEAVKTGRTVPDQRLDDVCAGWLRERELECTPQNGTLSTVRETSPDTNDSTIRTLHRNGVGRTIPPQAKPRERVGGDAKCP